MSNPMVDAMRDQFTATIRDRFDAFDVDMERRTVRDAVAATTIVVAETVLRASVDKNRRPLTELFVLLDALLKQVGGVR